VDGHLLAKEISLQNIQAYFAVVLLNGAVHPAKNTLGGI
jgi:hypothetical protein